MKNNIWYSIASTINKFKQFHSDDKIHGEHNWNCDEKQILLELNQSKQINSKIEIVYLFTIS